jgi:folate-binding Fe-S cluster repair protein YgfZ
VPGDEAVSATKGCYLGQEVVARGTARGHVNRRLCGLRLEGTAPGSGTPLVHDGHEVGRLTSVAGAFDASGAVALGFVRREHWAPGTRLKAGDAVAVVSPLPFA